MDEYDAEHWHQLAGGTNGAAGDGSARSIIYFVYHPHEGWTTEETADASFTANITIEKDVYYISYFPLQNSAGAADNIPDNEYHLALRKDNSDRSIVEAANADEIVDDLFHCGGDDKHPDGSAFGDEVLATACTLLVSDIFKDFPPTFLTITLVENNLLNLLLKLLSAIFTSIY